VGNSAEQINNVVEQHRARERVFPSVLTEGFVLGRAGKWNGWMNPRNYAATAGQRPHLVVHGLPVL
jgi:hypothetical protein